MVDVIVPTWAEINCCFALVIALGIFCVYAWNRGKREEERTVKLRKEWQMKKAWEEW